MSEKNKKQLFTTNALVKIALLSAISAVLQMMDFSIPIFPEFLKLDLSDIPAILAAVLVNPLAGVFVELIKNLIHMSRTSSAFVGEFANFLIGASLVLPIGIFCRKDKTVNRVAMGSVVGVLTMAAAGAFMNAFILLPLYAKLYGMDIMDFVAMSTAIFPFIDTLPKFILFTIVPFNIFKGVIVSVISVVLYTFLGRSLYTSR